MRGKFRLDFTSPPGELNYYLRINSDYVSSNIIFKVFLGGWNLRDGTYGRVPTVGPPTLPKPLFSLSF